MRLSVFSSGRRGSPRKSWRRGPLVPLKPPRHEVMRFVLLATRGARPEDASAIDLAAAAVTSTTHCAVRARVRRLEKRRAAHNRAFRLFHAVDARAVSNIEKWSPTI